jgi:hypothetical protein
MGMSIHKFRKIGGVTFWTLYSRQSGDISGYLKIHYQYQICIMYFTIYVYTHTHIYFQGRGECIKEGKY